MNNATVTADFGIATRRGSRRENLADAGYAHRFHDVLALAAVDGMGSEAATAEFARHAAYAGARVAARKGAAWGLLHVTETVADTAVEFPETDGVMAIAVARPGQPVVIAAVGDLRAYGLQDGKLTLLTVDQTQLERARTQGGDAARTGSVINNSIGRATLGSVQVVETFATVVVLVSDGTYRTLTHERMSDIIAAHSLDADGCAEALVHAVAEVGGADDAIAAVLSWQPPVRGDEGVLTGR